RRWGTMNAKGGGSTPQLTPDRDGRGPDERAVLDAGAVGGVEIDGRHAAAQVDVETEVPAGEGGIVELDPSDAVGRLGGGLVPGAGSADHGAARPQRDGTAGIEPGGGREHE